MSLAAIVSLIGATHSRSGLRVPSDIDRSRIQVGVTVTDAQLAAIRLTRHDFHGEWNYTVAAHRKGSQGKGRCLARRNVMAVMAGVYLTR